MAFKYEKNSLVIGDKKFDFEADIKLVVESKHRLFLLFEPNQYEPGVENEDRNAIALDEHGSFLWRIQGAGGGMLDKKTGIYWLDRYVSLRLDDEDRLIAFDTSSYAHIVNEETGRIVSSRWMK